MKLFGLELRRASKQELSRVPKNGYGMMPVMLESRERPMLLSTVYRCVDLISDSLAVLPLKIYELDADGFKREAKRHPLYWLLDHEPNEQMTRYTLMKTLMSSVLLNGNGYAYIERGSNMSVEQLVYLPATSVQIVFITDAEGVRHKRYWMADFNELVEPRDMLHVLNFSYDGIEGVSTLKHARQTLGIATDNEEAAAGFFKSGSATSGILTVEGARLSKEQKEQIYETWSKHMDTDTYGRHNGIQILEGNMKYQPISVNPKDSQMLESRQFSVIDICRFFSVSPVKAFDLSKSSYSTVEATQLQYLTDTVLSVITKMEQELMRKVLLPSERERYVIEFDTSVILRTDKTAQANYWRGMFNIGAATPNEIRKEMNLERMDGGDEAFVQVNVQPLARAAAMKAEGQE